MTPFTFVKCTYGGLSLSELETAELRDLGDAESILEEVASFHYGKPLSYDGYHATSQGIVYDLKDDDDCAAYHVKIIEK